MSIAQGRNTEVLKEISEGDIELVFKSLVAKAARVFDGAKGMLAEPEKYKDELQKLGFRSDILESLGEMASAMQPPKAELVHQASFSVLDQAKNAVSSLTGGIALVSDDSPDGPAIGGNGKQSGRGRGA
jgi:hypothetical protein